MQLIGMLDSPYVRRVAVSLQMLGLPFSHQSVSVFRHFDAFARINPVVKAPTLVCDGGEVLMDSSLILECAEAMARPRSLMPVDRRDLTQALRVIGLALAACEKSVQIIYERGLRPPEKQHEAWVERVTVQLLAACDALEAEVVAKPLSVGRTTMSQAGVTTAVTWHFLQQMIPEIVPVARCPALAAFSGEAEALPEFAAAPHGDGIVQAIG